MKMKEVGSTKARRIAKALVFGGLLVGTLLAAQSASAATKVVTPTSLTTCSVNGTITVVPTGTFICAGTTDTTAQVWTNSAGLVTADRPYLGTLRYCINNSTAVITTLTDGSASITCKSTETQVSWTRTWGVPTAAVIRNVSVTGTTTAMVAYSDSTANNGSQIVKYVITATPGVNNLNLPAINTFHYGPGSPTMKITGLHADTDYSFVVCATNAAGTTCTKPSQTVHTWPTAPILSLSSGAEVEKYGKAIFGYSPVESGGHSLNPAYLSTYSISPIFLNGLNFEATTGVLSGIPSGVHSAITYTITETNISGSSSATFTLTVNPASLTVTADDRNKVYGTSDPALSYQVTGYVLGESSTSLVGGLVRSDGNSHVGSYAITQGDLATGVGSNYVIDTFVPGTLSITPAPLTVTADDQTKVYGEVDPTLTYSVSGYITGESSTSFKGGLDGTDVTTGVGKHAITQGDLGTGLDSDYAITVFNPGTLNITPAPLVITADNKTKVYGQAANPALTYQVAGYVNNEASTPFIGALTRGDGVNVGSYAITQDTLALDGGSNYEIVGFNPGTLDITPAPLVITAENKTKVYGEADPVLTYTVSGYVNGETSASFVGGLIRENGVNVGNYSISDDGLATAIGSNYSIVTFNPGTLSITARAITVAADNKSKTVGADDPALTYTVTVGSLAAGDSFAGSLVRASGGGIGDYSITQGGLAISTGDVGNYAMQFVNGTFTINVAPVIVKTPTIGWSCGKISPFDGNTFHADRCLTAIVDGIAVDVNSNWRITVTSSNTSVLSHAGNADPAVLQVGIVGDSNVTVTLTSKSPLYTGGSIILKVHVSDSTNPTNGTVTL